MKIKKIVYRRLRNLGNFENETVELEADVENPDKIAEAFADLKWTASRLLGLRANRTDVREEAEEALQSNKDKENDSE